MKIAIRFLALVFLVLLFIFCVSNQAPVSVEFLNYRSPALPFFLVLIFTFFGGFFLALLWQAVRGSRFSGKAGNAATLRQSSVPPEPAPVTPQPPVPEKKKRRWSRKKQETASTDSGNAGTENKSKADATVGDVEIQPESLNEVPDDK